MTTNLILLIFTPFWKPIVYFSSEISRTTKNQADWINGSEVMLQQAYKFASLTRSIDQI